MPFKTSLGYHIAFVEKIEPIDIEPYENVKNIFIGQVFQNEIDKVVKQKQENTEIKFNFDNNK